ncbi:MAG: hypothetical protein IH840_11180 [Candidatus Heimdallarchaeota archaeon]|nr:hypothetical protein [Candidatus Heimdallarchaeota archaeon]
MVYNAAALTNPSLNEISFFVGTPPTNTSLLEKYLHRKVYIEKTDINTTIKNKECLARIVPDRFPDIHEYEKQTVLRPLVALTEEQIQSHKH